MSPVEFSRKLLDLWGCTLRIQKVPPHSPQPLTPQNKATDNPLIAREPVPQLATPAVTRSELAPSEAPSMDQIPLDLRLEQSKSNNIPELSASTDKTFEMGQSDVEVPFEKPKGL